MPVWLPYAITWLLSTIFGGAVVYGAMRAKFAALETALIGLSTQVGALSSKIDTHIENDMQAHERIARLEASSDQITDRLKTVGEQQHRFHAAHGDEERNIREWASAQFTSMQRWLTEQICSNLIQK